MATTPQTSVVAFFDTEASASHAITALKNAGFTSNQIGAAAGEGTSSLPTSSTTESSHAAMPGNLGEKTEGMWGKVKTFFEGGDTSGVEQYADEHATDRSSHEITGGYEAGDVSHSLGGMSISDEHSRYFEHRMHGGNNSVLVTVTAAGREQEAENILSQSGGDLGSEATGYDYEKVTQAPAAAATNGPQRIQLLGEVLRVHKDRISRGEVRISKQVITEQQMVQVPVSREELVIERVATSGTGVVHGGIGEDSVIRIPLSEEIASVDTQTVVREEVSIGKRAVNSVQDVAGSVRHEELQVEDDTTKPSVDTTAVIR